MTRAENIAKHIAEMRHHIDVGFNDLVHREFAHAIYAALATPECEAQGARLQDLPRLAEMVAGLGDRVEALEAERDELAATLENQYGDGEPPAPGWRYEDGYWRKGRDKECVQIQPLAGTREWQAFRFFDVTTGARLRRAQPMSPPRKWQRDAMRDASTTTKAALEAAKEQG